MGVSLPLTRAMRTLVYDAGALDWKTLTGAAALLLATALCACWQPARDAMRTDPSSLLRD
jgi:ABC-type lipoprotein release transport system permease subunit